MSHKLSIVAATAATLVIPALVPAPASAQPFGPGGGGPPGAGGGPGPGMRGGGPGPGMAGGGYVKGNFNRSFHGDRSFYVARGPIIGRPYHGGIWYGTGPRFWRGQRYAYGVGPCWLLSPIGYVWVCG
jgi:hypothetical protein